MLITILIISRTHCFISLYKEREREKKNMRGILFTLIIIIIKISYQHTNRNIGLYMMVKRALENDI